MTGVPFRFIFRKVWGNTPSLAAAYNVSTDNSIQERLAPSTETMIPNLMIVPPATPITVRSSIRASGVCESASSRAGTDDMAINVISIYTARTINRERMMLSRTTCWLFALADRTEAASTPTKHQRITAMASFTCRRGEVGSPVDASLLCQSVVRKRSFFTRDIPRNIIRRIGISLAVVTIKLRMAPSRMPAIRMA
ncbi:hypothetical protein SDC9_160979 [bioreactor metagenome]|uniref:Uncharacterized protein n=1 Tax=bioreactor metagenome TaxID=1076179 RepID=A0A645FJ42_9ZZZZ